MKKRKRLQGLAPIVDRNTKVLILGSFPGRMSLEKKEYYGNPRNHFWKIISQILDNPYTDVYSKKVNMLKAGGVGLWDVVRSCHRQGSSDNNISAARLNNFKKLLHKYPDIKAIFVNGKKAYGLFCAFCVDIKLPIECLPSTSPANAGQSYAYKKKKWRNIAAKI